MLKLIKNENIFNSKCEYIVNPVNTVGIMGKGLALQFKEKYPENFEKYKKYCQKGDFTVGKLLIINEKNKKIWMVKNKSAVNLINEKKDVNLQRRNSKPNPNQRYRVVLP